MPVRRVRPSIHRCISDRTKTHRERECRRHSSSSGLLKKKKHIGK